MKAGGSYRHGAITLLLVAVPGMGCRTGQGGTASMAAATTGHAVSAGDGPVRSVSDEEGYDVDLSHWAKRADLLQPPPPPVPRELQLPEVIRFKLHNGLDVIVVPRKGLPVVSFDLAIKSGAYDEETTQHGVALFTAEMLRHGTTGRSANEIAATIDGIGGVLTTDADDESSTASCTSLTKDQVVCLDLLSTLVATPSFPEESLDEVRDQLLGALAQRYDDPAQLAGEHFQNLVYGDDHPDGRPLVPEDYQRITRPDLVKFWNAHYRPNHSVLVVSGAVDERTVRPELEKKFALWKAGAVPPRRQWEMPARKGLRLLLVDKPDLTQATLVFGHRGLRHSHPEWYAATLVNYVLGGSDFSSRLTAEVRARRGLTYGITSSFGASLFDGVFVVSAATRNESTWSAFLASVTEIRRMKAEGPRSEELAQARGFFAGSYPFSLQSVQGLGGRIVGAELHGLGIPYVKQFALRMGRVSVQQAKAAAEEFLDPDDLTVVIVGKGDVIAPQLVAQKLRFERISYRDPISAQERARLRRGASTAVKSGESDRARALLETALEAQGGMAQFRGLRDLTIVKSGQREERGVVIDLFSTTRYSRPDKVRVEQETIVPDGKSQVVFVMTPQSVRGGPAGQPLRPVPEENSRQLRAAAFEDVNFIVLNILDAKPALPLQLAPPVSEGGKTYDGVTVRLPGGEWTTLLFDRATGFLARIRSEGGGGQKQEQILGDYLREGSILLPHRLLSTGPDRSQVKVTSVKVNSGLDPKLFQ